MAETMVNRLVQAIHEGLGGNGWAYSNYGGDELNLCRDKLEAAALAALSALLEPSPRMVAGMHSIKHYGSADQFRGAIAAAIAETVEG